VKDFPPILVFRKPLSRDLLRAVGLLVFAPFPLYAQAPSNANSTPVVIKPAPGKIAAIKSFRIVQEKDGQAVEILSTRPLVPAIQTITNPDRLVIDLPNARLDTPQKKISVQADQIGSLRADQFQQNPPIARVVVDLLAPRAYTWDAAGNRLVVHLGKASADARSSPFEQPTTPSLTSSPQPVVASVRTASPVALTGKDAGSGSTITAGPDTAVVNLTTGGEVHVCPGTTVSVTPSQNHHNIMLSMNTGALEAHVPLDASSDSVMTPDFRILLVGPGEFHYAISADNQGNTCVRALPGNTASAIVSELIGDRTYQVKASDQLMFHSGQLDRVNAAVPRDCGCPPPRDTALRATNNLPVESEASNPPSVALPPLNANPVPSAQTSPHVESAPSTGIPATAAATATAAPLDASVAPNELHVQVEAPLVFHATGPAPPPLDDVRALPLDARPGAMPALASPLPPPVHQGSSPDGSQTASANPPPKRGFFRKLGGFFAALFR
jgi:hypothetical protein